MIRKLHVLVSGEHKPLYAALNLRISSCFNGSFLSDGESSESAGSSEKNDLRNAGEWYEALI